MAQGQEGWYTGGQMQNGQWSWADGSPMSYNNFGNFGQMNGGQMNGNQYGAIMYNNGQYNWGYAPARGRRMGYICELPNC